MRMQSNTILITGGGSGIGRGLAAAFHQLGNQVLITGRREDALRAVCGAHPGMRHFLMDVADPQSVHASMREILREFPAVNCVFNNAGVQHAHRLGGELDETAVAAEIDTNFLGAILVASDAVAHLKQRENAVLVNVSSGLAFVPLARFPVYCATKAALHSFTMSLRRQLQGSGVKVVELIPPYVATDLGGPRKQPSPHGPQPMPLDSFITQAMQGLATDEDEIAVGDAQGLRAAASPESVGKIFLGMNR